LAPRRNDAGRAHLSFRALAEFKESYMLQNPDEHQQLVEQKMQARAERHIRESQAQAAEQAEEARTTLADQAKAEVARQQNVVQKQQQEARAEARRTRPVLLVQFRANPAGIRLAETMQEVCLTCGSEQPRCQSTSEPPILVCPECSTRWSVSACWSCDTGRLDTRDPETPRCEKCGYTRCADCGACNPNGCSTNPYSLTHRQRDTAVA
jgi:hypothetical protein